MNNALIDSRKSALFTAFEKMGFILSRLDERVRKWQRGVGGVGGLLKKIVLLPALKPHFDGAISENENLVSLWESAGRREKGRFISYGSPAERMNSVEWQVQSEQWTGFKAWTILASASGRAKRIFCSSKCPYPLKISPSSLLSKRTSVTLDPTVTWPGRDVDHSPLSSPRG